MIGSKLLTIVPHDGVVAAPEPGGRVVGARVDEHARPSSPRRPVAPGRGQGLRPRRDVRELEPPTGVRCHDHGVGAARRRPGPDRRSRGARRRGPCRVPAPSARSGRSGASCVSCSRWHRASDEGDRSVRSSSMGSASPRSVDVQPMRRARGRRTRCASWWELQQLTRQPATCAKCANLRPSSEAPGSGRSRLMAGDQTAGGGRPPPLSRAQWTVVRKARAAAIAARALASLRVRAIPCRRPVKVARAEVLGNAANFAEDLRREPHTDRST